MAENAPSFEQKRQYHRIPSIIPVDYQLLDDEGVPLDLEIRTGVTQNVSGAGLGLEVRNLPARLAERLDQSDVELGIVVDVSIPGRTLRIPGRVAWSGEAQEGRPTARLLGLEFRDLKPDAAAAIETYARRMARRPKIIRGVIAGLGALLVIGAAAYAWQYTRHQAEIYRSQRAVTEARAELGRSQQAANQAQAQATRATGRLGNLQVSLRWMAARVGNILKLMERDAQNGRPPSEALAPAIDNLEVRLDKLQGLIDEIERPGSQGGRPPQPTP